MPSNTFTWLRPLLAAALLCAMSAMLPAPLAQEDEAGRLHTIPLFMSATDSLERQGFVRVINHSEVGGTVRIYGFDDAGTQYGPAELAIGANQTVHFNSNDFENGNAGKGLPQGVGQGEGNWRLVLFGGELDIEPLAYIRTRKDGFLTSMHDVAAEAAIGHRVPIFNPARNRNQESWLRLINPGDAEVDVTIAGRRDDDGESRGEVTLTIPAGGATRVTATDLESGASHIDGSLDAIDSGKTTLFVSADGPIQVMNLMSTPTGHLSNLSAGKRDYTGAVGMWRVSFDEDLDDGYIVLMPDSRMYAWLPESADVVRLARGTYRSGTATVSGSGELYESGKVELQGLASVIGGSDDFEFTADYRSGDWIQGKYTVDGGAARAFRGWATTGFGRGSSNLDVLGLWAAELGDDADLPGDFELDSEGNFDISFDAAGYTCDADGQLLPVNSAFNVYEADPYIICANLIVFARGDVELVLAVMDTPDSPGGGGRAIILVVVPDSRKIALGATFLLEAPTL